MSVMGGVHIGPSYDVRIMGILNTSPESFYKKSVQRNNSAIRDTAKQFESDGADFIDVGGMSTAPYLETIISAEIEKNRILDAVKIIQNSTNLPISVDTCRASVAEAAVKSGVEIINDISGLKYDTEMCKVLSRYDNLSVILCAFSSEPVLEHHCKATSRLLQESLSMATTSASIPVNKIVLDPSIGFFRNDGIGPFYTKIQDDQVTRDITVIRNLKHISPNIPIMVSVSNKSFLGSLLKESNPLRRHAGTIAAETASVLYGANIIRTHDVKAAKDASVVADALMRSEIYRD